MIWMMGIGGLSTQLPRQAESEEIGQVTSFTIRCVTMRRLLWTDPKHA